MQNHIASIETAPSTQITQTQGVDSKSPKETQPQQTDESDPGSQGTEEVVSTQNTQTQGVDSESPKKTQPQQMDESDSGSQGIEEVVSSTSSQEEVMVDPTTLDPPMNTLNEAKKPKRDEKKNKCRLQIEKRDKYLYTKSR